MPQTGTAWVPVYPDVSKVTPETRRAFSRLGPYAVSVEPQVKDLDSVRRALASLPHVVVPVDVDDRELMALRAKLQELGNHTVGVDISAGDVRAQLDEITRRLDRLSGQTARIQVAVDAGAASAALAGAEREVSRLDGRTARINVVADVASAIGGLALVWATAERLNGSNVTIGVVADTARAIAGLAMVAAKAGTLAGLAGGVGALVAVVAALGPAGAAAAGGLGAAVLAFGGVGKALTALGAQQDSAGKDAAASAQKQAQSAAQVQSAQERLGQAYGNVASVRQNVADAAARASTQVQRAEAGVAQATEQARQRVAQAAERGSRAIETAQRQQATAQRQLRQATRDLDAAQGALNDAWEAGRRALQDLQDQVDGNALDQRQAAFDLADAKKALDEARASGDADQIARAQLAYDRQVETIDQLNKQTQRLTAQNSEAQRLGVGETKEVIDANLNLAAARERVGDAERSASEASLAVDRARVDAAAEVAQARTEGDRQIAAARQSLADAELSAQQQERQGREQMAAANQQVIEAQRALQQALADTGTEGSAAADAVAVAMANLSPAAAAFVRYLWSLKPLLDELRATAAAAFFPPFQAGLEALVGQFSIFRTVVGQFAGAMGAALGYVLTQLASPWWTTFFSILGNAAGPLLGRLAVVLMQVAQAAAGLIVALLPFAPAGLQMLGLVGALVAAWTPFIAIMTGQLLPVFPMLVAALMPLGAVLGALSPILAVLGQAFAMVLGAVLQALVPVLVALTPLIQQLALAFAAQLVDAIQSATPLLVAVATWMSAHPQLVLAVISALAGLLGAFHAISAVVSAVFSPLLMLKLAMNLFGFEAAAAGGVVGGLGARFAGFFGSLFRGTGVLGLARTLVEFLAGMLQRLAGAALAAIGPLGWIAIALGVLYSQNEAFRGAVNGLLGVLMQLVGTIIGSLAPVLDVVVAIMGVLGGVFAGVAAGLATALVPVVQALAELLSWLTPVIVPLVQLFLAVRTAMMLWAAAQWALNIAMAANPIGLIILAVAALVGAVVWAYQNVGWFRDAVNALWSGLSVVFSAIGAVAVWLWQNIFVPAWNAIAGAVSWAWTTIIQPVASAIGTALAFLGAVIFTILVAPFLIAWNLISAAVSWAWDTIIKPVFDAHVAAIQLYLAPTISWLYTNIFLPTWNAIGAVIGFVWNSMILPVWNALVWFVNAVIVPVILFLYNNVMLPMWNAIGMIISFVWNSVILPVWNALILFINAVIIPTTMFLYNNVIMPIWTAIGNTIQFVWANIIKPAWDAVAAGLSWLGDRFREGTDRIGQIWNTIRGLLAKPINFMIDVVWNRGVVPAWNAVAGLVGLGPIQPLGLIPEFREGGPLSGGRRDHSGRLHGPGTGTSDSIIAQVAETGGAVKVSRNETVMTSDVSRKVPSFLAALNAGDGEALQAAGAGAAARRYTGPRSGFDMNPMTVVAFAAGGQIEERIAAAKAWLSGPARGAPYVYGGGTNPRQGMDCSSMQSAVTHILSGRPPDSGRIGSTGSMPWGGFVPGIEGQYAIGNKPNDHMAGTLAGQNVEQHGPNGSPFQFPSRWGADNGYFPQKFHLQEVGGAFVSGGAGGGGGIFDWITPAIRAAFERFTNPAIDALRGLVGEPPPEWRRVPPALATKSRDALLDFMLSKVSAFLGGGAMGETSDEAPAIVRIISDVARGRFGPLARDAAVIGTATGLVESDLRNLPGGDRDSVGVFQQRPSMGWGSIEECRNVTHAAGMFFSRFPGNWRGMDPGMVAQSVQRSAFPAKYGQRMGQARGLVDQFGGPFDDGGWALGRGVMFKDVIRPERVLDPVESDAGYRPLVRLSSQLSAGQVPVASAEVAAVRAAALTERSNPQMPSEMRLTSGQLRILGPDLVEIVDGRIELLGDLVNDRK